jgi:hypothetical protein
MVSAIHASIVYTLRSESACRTLSVGVLQVQATQLPEIPATSPSGLSPNSNSQCLKPEIQLAHWHNRWGQVTYGTSVPQAMLIMHNLQIAYLKTVEVSNVKIVVKGKDVTINAAKVVTVDIKASNGVIHVIDSVIMPPAGKNMAPKGEKKY